jgi:hypothetical protein
MMSARFCGSVSEKYILGPGTRSCGFVSQRLSVAASQTRPEALRAGEYASGHLATGTCSIGIQGTRDEHRRHGGDESPAM